MHLPLTRRLTHATLSRKGRGTSSRHREVPRIEEDPEAGEQREDRPLAEEAAQDIGGDGGNQCADDEALIRAMTAMPRKALIPVPSAPASTA